jgi:hypothetical protein
LDRTNCCRSFLITTSFTFEETCPKLHFLSTVLKSFIYYLFIYFFSWYTIWSVSLPFSCFSKYAPSFSWEKKKDDTPQNLYLLSILTKQKWTGNQPWIVHTTCDSRGVFSRPILCYTHTYHPRLKCTECANIGIRIWQSHPSPMCTCIFTVLCIRMHTTNDEGIYQANIGIRACTALSHVPPPHVGLHGLSRDSIGCYVPWRNCFSVVWLAKVNRLMDSSSSGKYKTLISFDMDQWFRPTQRNEGTNTDLPDNCPRCFEFPKSQVISNNLNECCVSVYTDCICLVRFA